MHYARVDRLYHYHQNLKLRSALMSILLLLLLVMVACSRSSEPVSEEIRQLTETYSDTVDLWMDLPMSFFVDNTHETIRFNLGDYDSYIINWSGLRLNLRGNELLDVNLSSVEFFLEDDIIMTRISVDGVFRNRSMLLGVITATVERTEYGLKLDNHGFSFNTIE